MVFDQTDPTSTITNAVVGIVNSGVKPKIDAVLVFTETGFTARSISRYRLKIPVIAITDKKATAETLTLSYGVHPVVTKIPSGAFSSAEAIIKELVKSDTLHTGDTIIVVHGYHWQKAGNTNALAIVTI
jgi:pyruvate kinase